MVATSKKNVRRLHLFFIRIFICFVASASPMRLLSGYFFSTNRRNSAFLQHSNANSILSLVAFLSPSARALSRIASSFSQIEAHRSGAILACRSASSFRIARMLKTSCVFSDCKHAIVCYLNSITGFQFFYKYSSRGSSLSDLSPASSGLTCQNSSLRFSTDILIGCSSVGHVFSQ